MVVLECTLPLCEFKTADVSEAIAIALLQNHGLSHQAGTTGNANSTPGPRAPALERPKIDVGVSTEEWNVFVRRWEVFRSGSGITENSAPAQLFQCAGPQLGDNILKTRPNATRGSLDSLLETMRSLAVIPVAIGVLRTELLQLNQERDEPFRSFAARVQGKAETCEFVTRCDCGEDVDYTPHMTRDVLLNGVSDPDIRREVLGIKDITHIPVNDVISMVEAKEKARNALPSANLSAMSSFRRQASRQGQAIAPQQNIPSPADQAKEGICPDCKQRFRQFTEGQRGWNSKPHQVCISCYRARRRNKKTSSQATTSAILESTLDSPISQIASVTQGTRRPRRGRRTRQGGKKSSLISTTSSPPVRLDHHVFTKGAWRRGRLKDHPTVSISISAENIPPETCARAGEPLQAHVHAVADTGAQSDLWSLSQFLAHGFPRNLLRPVNMSLSAANRSPISIEGAFFAKLTRQGNGASTECKSMVYVSSTIDTFYLSCETLFNLGILPEDFPNLTNEGLKGQAPGQRTATTCAAGNSTCTCPRRERGPERPNELPFECVPENIPKMRDWLLNRYAASTFNTCPHQTLPHMDGPEIEIHVDPEAKPKACHTPATIPLHWQKQVHDDLIRDEDLGVIERVPYGEPVTWCHRMVVTRKHDGSPRRTVDLSPLNKFCRRETFASETPFNSARRVPKDSWKTVTDAWNGYHSVPLRESDRHLTTFITPFGRWRAPQGFLSSGDGYNRRFDEILSSFERKERCVDDTVHYDKDLTEHWWRTMDLLTLLGNAGIVLNPNKLQFSLKSVDFAGFRISDSSIEPLPKYLDAIRDFPTPTSTTDIRSWFGLVNQVANYAQLREAMEPFKPFLSPRCLFTWSPELDRAFQRSKDEIVKSIRHGVEIFDASRRTCLRPDWSKKGIGYFLMQKHCACPSDLPDCCQGGWRITLAGSRFLSPAEQRYAAIEGEALAVAWGLEQTRYFTQGCDNLIVVTDHKPLTKVLGDRTLDEISNSRLFRLKQRTLPWRFAIAHLPGKLNYAADATSRHPSSITEQDDEHERQIMGSIRAEAHRMGVVSWAEVALKTSEDPTLNALIRMIRQDALEAERPADPGIAGFWPIRHSLYVDDGVIMYQDRVVIPPTLRPQVLDHLHSAHQGTSTMEHRARKILFWPGMSNDIRLTREKCYECNRNAPSQPPPPTTSAPPPSTPFEAVFADFFQHGGQHYLVVGDRLSGWVEVFGSPSGTTYAGAQGLIRYLRTFFATFGVPEEISSDGGPEFTAGPTQTFLANWGVRHRLSSAHFPQSNGRAEVAVKTAKRLLGSNTGPSGSLNHDSFLRAILQLRNTPDPDCSISPAEIVFGRPLRDTLSFATKLEKFTNPNIRPLWRDAWAAKEEALRTRAARTTESLSEHTRLLRPLKMGERVFVQNQQGPHANKWDRSGVVLEDKGHDQYTIKVDGSGRLTLRNRRFLRAYTPATPHIVHTPHVVQTPDPIVQAEPTPTSQTEEGSAGIDNTVVPRDIDADSMTVDPRPRRDRRPPKRYEPETGCWVPSLVAQNPRVTPRLGGDAEFGPQRAAGQTAAGQE